MSKEIKASDYFKEYGDRTKPTPNTDNWYSNRSIWAKNGIQTSNTHPKEKEKPLKTLMNSGLYECKVITYNGDVQVSVSACNRVQSIEIYNQSLSYADCTKIEEVTDNSKYDMYKANNYKVYDLYKYNFVANADTVHMTIAAR